MKKAILAIFATLLTACGAPAPASKSAAVKPLAVVEVSQTQTSLEQSAATQNPTPEVDSKLGKFETSTYTVRTLCDFTTAILAGNYKGLANRKPSEILIVFGDPPTAYCREGTEVEIYLLNFNIKHPPSTQAVLAAIKQHGHRPATWPELLALGVQHPDLQRQFNIVGLGSIWHPEMPAEHRGMLMLWETEVSHRVIDIIPDFKTWKKKWHFATVRDH